MTEPAPDTMVSSEVEVAVDPDTAFLGFTEELDLWWVWGLINYYAAGRCLAMRCEPGVGGRLLEVYDDAAGDALELGRVTVWEPGKRLAWDSSVDDVTIEVSFSPAGDGCLVRVQARTSGATIVTELSSPWGLPFYVADDPEGNRWTFAQARPTMR